jgi:MFS family permease
MGLISPFGQLYGTNLMKRKSRKSIMMTNFALQSLMWPALILLGIFAYNNWFIMALPIFLICFRLLYNFFGSSTGPIWLTLMGDIVPVHSRGRFFSKRNIIISLVSITISLSSSFLLDTFESLNIIFYGFLIIFIVAFITKIISISYFNRHYFPYWRFERKIHINFFKFLKRLPKDNIGLYTLYMTFLTFAVNLSGPFIGIYMLNVLNFSYLEYVSVSMATPLISILFYPLIGLISDKYGNAMLMKVCGLLLPIVPILWIFMNTPIQLIFGPQLVSAFLWTGMNLGTMNFKYDNSTSQQRGFYEAYSNIFTGFGTFFGGILGSLLLGLVPIIFISEYETLMLISGIARFIFAIIFLLRIKEVRIKRANNR